MVEPAVVGAVRRHVAAGVDTWPTGRCFAICGCAGDEHDGTDRGDGRSAAAAAEPGCVRRAEVAAADGAGDRGRKNRRRAAFRRVPAGVLWAARLPPRAQSGRPEDRAETIARIALGVCATRVRYGGAEAAEAGVAQFGAGAAIHRHCRDAGARRRVSRLAAVRWPWCCGPDAGAGRFCFDAA